MLAPSPPLRDRVILTLGTPDHASLVPASLRARTQDLGRGPRTVQLAGHPAWRYRGLVGRGGDEALDVTVLPGRDAVLSVACVSTVRDALAAPDCAAAITSVSLGGAPTLVPAPDLGLRLVLPRALDDAGPHPHRGASGARCRAHRRDPGTVGTPAGGRARQRRGGVAARRGRQRCTADRGAVRDRARLSCARPSGGRSVSVSLPTRPARGAGKRCPARRRRRRRRPAPGADRRRPRAVAGARGERHVGARLAASGHRVVGLARRRLGDPRAAPSRATSSKPATGARRAAGRAPCARGRAVGRATHAGAG